MLLFFGFFFFVFNLVQEFFDIFIWSKFPLWVLGCFLTWDNWKFLPTSKVLECSLIFCFNALTSLFLSHLESLTHLEWFWYKEIDIYIYIYQYLPVFHILFCVLNLTEENQATLSILNRGRKWDVVHSFQFTNVSWVFVSRIGGSKGERVDWGEVDSLMSGLPYMYMCEKGLKRGYKQSVF